jgi:urea transport system permease protein
MTLVGPVIGALLANYARTSLSEQFPSGWLYLQGAMFVILVAFAPKGIAGVADRFRGGFRGGFRGRVRAGADTAGATGEPSRRGEGAVGPDVEPEPDAVTL